MEKEKTKLSEKNKRETKTTYVLESYSSPTKKGKTAALVQF